MASIGAQLAEAREAKGLSVADVATRLHLRAMVVDAMERENFRPIGEPVYVRGFVRSYARLVGLAPEPLIEQLNVEFYPPPPPEPAAEDARSSRNGEVSAGADDAYTFERHVRIERQSSFYPWLLGALTTVAALLVFMVVRVYFFAPTENVAQTSPVVSQPVAANGGDAVPATPDANAMVTAADRGLTSSQSGVKLRLQLTQDCWLAVVVDGKRVLYETLPAGSVREFRGARTITLRAGNAGGVVATVDGQPLGTLGSKGQVQERIFAAKSVEPPVTGPRE